MKMSKNSCGAVFAALIGLFALTGPVPAEMHAAQEASTAAKTSPEMDRLKNLIWERGTIRRHMTRRRFIRMAGAILGCTPANRDQAEIRS